MTRDVGAAAPAGVVPEVHKIAVLRANAIGDYVMTTPALAALRATYPDAEIVLLGTPWHADFVRARPGPVDCVEVVPPSKGVREPQGRPVDSAENAAFFARMRDERFDLAFQLHGGGRYSNPFVRALGARVTVGLRAPDAAPLDRSLPYVYYQPEVLRFAETVALAGAQVTDPRPHVAVTDADLEEAATALGDLSRPLAVIHPGVHDPRRRWSARSFAAVGDALARARATVVVTGAADDATIVDEVVGAMRERAKPLTGALSLGGLTGVLALAAVVVANDTGPRHLAEAVGTATVGVYWCGNLVNAGPMTRAHHRPAISWTVHCPVCGADCATVVPGRPDAGCAHAVSFVDCVTVEEVRESALQLLELERERKLAPSVDARSRRATRGFAR